MLYNGRMPDEKKKAPKARKRPKHLTGEDIEMLHEGETDPEGSESSGSYRYKDDIDGA